MGKPLDKVIAGLPAQQQEDIHKRSAQLNAEEEGRLRADIAAGLRDIDEGRSSPFDEEAVARIQRRRRDMLLKR